MLRNTNIQENRVKHLGYLLKTSTQEVFNSTVRQAHATTHNSLKKTSSHDNPQLPEKFALLNI